jgi:hypothetical protein
MKLKPTELKLDLGSQLNKVHLYTMKGWGPDGPANLKRCAAARVCFRESHWSTLRCVGADHVCRTCSELVQGICALAKDETLAEHIIVDVIRMHYGMGTKNPLDFVRWYRLDQIERGAYRQDAVDLQVEGSRGSYDQTVIGLPREFQCEYVLVYSRDLEKVALVKELFRKWAETKDSASDAYADHVAPAIAPTTAYDDDDDDDDDEFTQFSQPIR